MPTNMKSVSVLLIYFDLKLLKFDSADMVSVQRKKMRETRKYILLSLLPTPIPSSSTQNRFSYFPFAENLTLICKLSSNWTSTDSS